VVAADNSTPMEDSLICPPRLGYAFARVSAETPKLNTSRVTPREHVVLFYDNDAELGPTVGACLREALFAGSVAVVIASEAHLEIFEQEVATADFDLGELRRSGYGLPPMPLRRSAAS
jgi:hypothetical protein